MIADAKILELACSMGSIEAKPVMPQHAIRYTSKPSKLKCFPAEYASINKTKKGAFDWKVVHELGRFAFCGVGKSATWTGIAHLLDTRVHPRPIIPWTETVESTVGIHMAANRIRMEGNEEYVVEFLRNELKASVG